MAQRPNQACELLRLEPVTRLLERTQAELAGSFDFSKPMRISRAPGRLDVMGGIADYTGSLVCEMPIDRAAAVVTQRREDRQIQVFSFKYLHRRVFLMAPIHHHFEKKGWAEPQIVIRFWIISLILAMIGLATLKVR